MERFTLNKATEPGWWLVADTQNGVVIKFKEHQFNDTQEVKMTDECKEKSVSDLARIMREIGDWMANNYYNIAM